MAHVFLSYAREDRTRAAMLAEALERDGLTVWWDRTILPGARFDQMIDAALAAAHCAVVLWSPAATASTWVVAEADEAAGRGILVPAIIEPATIPLPYRRLQAAALTGWNGDRTDPEYGKLLAAVRSVVGSADAPQKAAPASIPARGIPARPARRRLGEFLRTPAGALVALTGALPLANLWMQIIPLRTWDEGGLAYLTPAVVTLAAGFGCLAMLVRVLGRPPSGAERRNRPLGPAMLAGSVAALAVFAIVHTAVAQDFYFDVLGWESSDVRRIAGDLVLAATYTAGWALLTGGLAVYARGGTPHRSV